MVSQLQPFAVEIRSHGRTHLVDAAWIAARVRDGLTPLDYEMIDLIASDLRCDLAELMRLALESEGEL
jgi:hypothetical protein